MTCSAQAGLLMLIENDLHCKDFVQLKQKGGFREANKICRMKSTHNIIYLGEGLLTDFMRIVHLTSLNPTKLKHLER